MNQHLLPGIALSLWLGISVFSGHSPNNFAKQPANHEVKMDSGIQELFNGLPVFGSGLHFTRDYQDKMSFSYKGKTDYKVNAVLIPVQYYAAMNTDIVSYDGGYDSKMSSFSKQRAAYPFGGTDELTLSAYFRLDLGDGLHHIFCSKNEMAQGKLRSKEFLIYSFDKTGSPISELGKCADLYVINNVVWQVWYYASDDFPTYEKTIVRSSGHYETVYSGTDKPAELAKWGK